MGLCVQVLWVVSFPPLPFSIGFGQLTVVVHGCLWAMQVVALGWLVPCPCVLLRTYVHRVPWLVFRVPQVVVVVVVSKHKEILCTTTLVFLYQSLRIPLLSLEEGQDVFESHL